MTGTVTPSGRVPVAVLAYGRPVSSAIGSASKSARTATTGPGPVGQHADDTQTADAGRHLEPGGLVVLATTPAVRTSAPDSSGWVCRSW